MKKRPIKILRIQSRICIGGPAIHTELLSAHLPKDEFKTVLVGGAVDNDEFSKFESLKDRGIDIRIIDEMRRETSVRDDFVAVWKIFKIIKKEKPDIVHTHTAKAGAVGRAAAILAGVPLIFHTFHGHTFENYFSKPVTETFKFIERVLARFSTKIIAISPRQKYDLSQKHSIIGASNIEVIKLGFELQPFFDVCKSDVLKQQLQLGDDDVLIGIIGRLVPIKNHLAALRILHKLHEKDARYHLCIVGDGPERQKIEQQITQLRLKKYVHFLGWCEDVAPIYAGIDLLLLTSLNEGTPVAIIEAMATKTPVVSSAVGGVPDLITNEKNGFIYPLDKEEFAVDYVLKIINGKSCRSQITATGEEFARENYLYTRLVGDVVSLYRNYSRKMLAD